MSYRLYVIIMSDLESMTVGKAAAQVAHAASQAAFLRDGSKIEYDEWCTEDRDINGSDGRILGFGTTIVLDGGSFNDDDYDKIPEHLEDEIGHIGDGVVKDPGYPIRDGKKTHLIPLVTCYWVLCDPDQSILMREWLDQFKLYNGNHD